MVYPHVVVMGNHCENGKEEMIKFEASLYHKKTGRTEQAIVRIFKKIVSLCVIYILVQLISV